MRKLKSKKLKWDKRNIIAYFCVLIAAIICGIVLFKIGNVSSYVYNFADDYVFYIFNFRNGNLFVSRFLSELFYLYVAFLIAYVTKFKFLCVAIMFLRALFAVLYSAILFSLFGTEGLIVATFIFIPAFCVSFLFFLFISEQCRIFTAPVVFIIPAVLALLNSAILLLLVNVVFRVVVVIV